ncbi:MAG: cation-translocating P-type ATPase [Bacteroidota bacterium]
MESNHYNITGLTQEQVLDARKKYGTNQLGYKKENGFLVALINVAKEPMVILLLAAAILYFTSGDAGDGIFMFSSVILVSAISLYQDSRSRNALEKLNDFSEPYAKVIRDGSTIEIKKEELVIGDNIVIEEGSLVPADGIIIHSNDFSVNESILTGEAMAVYKDVENKNNLVYHGTTVASGLAIAAITAIGNQTQLGKIGISLENIKEEKTPLEKQINRFVKMMVVAGAVVFIIVWGINYRHSHLLLDSLLKALTLAMSILPEEIPVAFTTFMALGAWRLMKMGILVKQMKTVETLGSATVICTDKTGTLTENKMSLVKIFADGSGKITSPDDDLTNAEINLINLSMWSSESIPFDSMEVAIHKTYGEITALDERPFYKMIHEYPLSGKPPMMTHIFENAAGKRIVAAKGAPEAIMLACNLTAEQKQNTESVIQSMAEEGYRVLGVGEASIEGDHYPDTQQEIIFQFRGIIAFYDPPKKNIKNVLNDFYKAGIDLKIITGDNRATTTSIAKEIAFKGYEKSITGDELMLLPDKDLVNKVKDIYLYTRMFPEAKLRIINALKSANEIVAMTGDGVNDGPALKAAHIGIAMGKKGTEIAKQAASLVLLEDDLSKIVDAIAMGRRIYSNLKKAIQYIISIHIPIILTVFLPLVLGWVYPNIFSPVHIIFLELIMGPTCSIIYENEPIEKNAMLQRPRLFSTNFFNRKELLRSIIQGLAITAGTLTAYQLSIHAGYNELLTRTMVFTALISANIFLTLVNRSFYYSILTTLRYKNNLLFIMVSITLLITACLLYVKPLADFFLFEPLSVLQVSTCIAIGFVSVTWIELQKWWKRSKSDISE